MKTLKECVFKEIELFRQAAKAKEHDRCFKHLADAHVLSQSSAYLHLYVHWLMLMYAFGRRDTKEIFGQLIRLAVTTPGHLMGQVPVGNIGWATVGLTQTMPVSEEIQQKLKESTMKQRKKVI